jgi:hypothetical protein
MSSEEERMRSIQDVLERLDGVKQHGDHWMARCPAHEDDHPSLSITTGRDGRPLLNCHAGCEFKDIAEQLGFRMQELLPDREPPTNGKHPREIETTYDYTDANGKMLYQVVRLRGKEFKQRRPDGRGDWTWNLQGTPRVLFQLPRVHLAVAKGRTVFMVEGERDVQSLERWDLCATTNSGGAEKWEPQHAEILTGAQVVILPDNDEKGRRHAEMVGHSLAGKAKSVRLLELPGLPEKGDVTDWIAAGGTYEEFSRLARRAPLWTPATGEGLPAVLLTNRPLRDMTKDAMHALELSNIPPRVFIRAGSIVRWRRDENGRPMIEELSAAHVRGLLTRSADFLHQGKDGLKHAPPPDHVVADILAAGEWSFPNLLGLTEIPLLRADGSILGTPGYDAATRLVYTPALGLTIPPIPERPTEAEVRAAVDLIDDAIGQFPFQDDASRANARAVLLTPTVRAACPGPRPLALVDAPQQGTGKSLFAEVVTLVATGRPAAMMQAPREDEEWRKSLTASFRNGDTIMIYDNVETRLSAPSLAMALTAPVWKDRILGGSDVAEFPIECTWIATGNNLQPDGDIPRRSYWIRLDAETARPWERTGFKHSDLRGWVLANRGRLVAALLTISRAWFVAGCPCAECPKMGSFEEWARVVGGILANAGIEGFLGNFNTMFDQLDTASQQWEAFLAAWSELYRSEPKRVAEIVSDLRSIATSEQLGYPVEPALRAFRETLPDNLGADVAGSEDRLRRRLGIAFSKKVAVRYGPANFRLERASRDNHAMVERWQVLHGK